MKIYTRTGDDGTTGLFGGGRVQKHALRVDAYGTVDEANASIGRARVALSQDARLKSIDEILEKVQSLLFTLGAELATTPTKEAQAALKMPLIAPPDSTALEAAIDAAELGMAPLTHFVLPGGSLASAELHIARCVTRRAERLVVALGQQEHVREEIVVFLNRLSDLLFTLARRANHLLAIPDVPWIPHPRKSAETA